VVDPALVCLGSLRGVELNAQDEFREGLALPLLLGLSAAGVSTLIKNIGGS